MRRREVLAGLAVTTAGTPLARAAGSPWLSPDLPSGTRDAAAFGGPPGKRDLIALSDRPPNYETPMDAFRTTITPNDRFFVRYHLSEIPDMAALRDWSLTIGGDAAGKPMTLTLDALRAMPAHEITAVCQCSGNRRGLFSPHVAGVEWGNGAMGCAAWRGPRLRDVLAMAGVTGKAVEVWLDGADHPLLDGTPDFQKSLPRTKALHADTIIAIEMNGAPLPWLNGYPARIVVPGWTATYWMKHVTRIQASSAPLNNFWMQKAYRVPARMFAVDQPFPTQDNDANWPITDIVVNSLIAAPLGDQPMPRAGFVIEGVAWDRGHGISGVAVTLDGGATWRAATLEPPSGPYAFHGFRLATGPLPPGSYEVAARATSLAGETQAASLKFNPAGYHDNVPAMITLAVA